MKKIVMAVIALSVIASAEVDKTNVAKAIGVTVVGALAFPGILVAEFWALGLQRNDKCDDKHNIYLYVPLPKRDTWKIRYTCEEWVK